MYLQEKIEKNLEQLKLKLENNKPALDGKPVDMMFNQIYCSPPLENGPEQFSINDDLNINDRIKQISNFGTININMQKERIFEENDEIEDEKKNHSENNEVINNTFSDNITLPTMYFVGVDLSDSFSSLFFLFSFFSSFSLLFFSFSI